MTAVDFDSRKYWQDRYTSGSNSGAGSFGRLARFKAQFLNSFISLNNIESVIDFGCGDGNQLTLFEVPKYIGVDISEVALARCRRSYGERTNYSFANIEQLDSLPRCDMSISLDVVYHLVEDKTFESYIRNLFLFAKQYCVIYSSNGGSPWTAKHVHHRVFTTFISETFPEWRLAAHIPNAYPFDPRDESNTSFSDFFVYAEERSDCTLMAPGRR